MRESCLKFLDLDFNDLNEQDLDHLLYLYFDGKLEIEEDLFYKNYELALDSFIKNHRDSFLNDKKELSNKMGYYIFCLYGKEKLEKYLTDLNLTSFNTSNVTSTRTMFNGCSSLSSLDLRNFDTTNVQDYSLMFGSVTADVYIGENWNSAMTNIATGYTKEFL